MRKFRGFSLTRGIPADASSAYCPNPQANNRIFPGERSAHGHLSLKDYSCAHFHPCIFFSKTRTARMKLKIAARISRIK